MVMLALIKEEQDKLGDDIINLQEDFKVLLNKYDFKFDGAGLDLINGQYEIFGVSNK